MRLKDKSAIITGAASGIGKATAILFAKEGAKVCIADINDTGGYGTVSEIENNGGEAIFVHADVTVPLDIENTILKTINAFGSIDILINNATSWKGDSYILDVDEATWTRILDASLKSTYLCSKLVLPHMIRAGNGSIINISSINALLGIHLTAYTAAKGGLLALSRLLAVHYGRKGVRVNVICPGSIETEGVKPEFERNPSLKENLTRLTQLGRIGKPEEIAYCALYLASDESSFTTGATFIIDGGLSAGINADFMSLLEGRAL